MVFGVFRTAIMALRMDTAGYVRDMFTAGLSTEAFDRAVQRSGKNVGLLQAQMAVAAAVTAGLAGKMVSDFARFEQEVTIASLATGEGTSRLREMSTAALGLSQDLATPPQEMASLVKQVQFFGLRSEESVKVVSEFSGRLAQIAGTDAPSTAENLVRLLNITRRSGETMDEAALRADTLAAGIFAVGTNITAGIEPLLKFIQQFQVAGVTANFTENQLVGLAGAVADLVPQMRSITTTAVVRAFTTEEFPALAKALNTTEEEVRRLRKENPIEFMIQLGRALEVAGGEDKLISTMKDIGLGGRREAKGLLALIANLDRVRELTDLASREQENLSKFMEASEAVLATTQKRIEAFTNASRRLSIQIGSVLAPAFTLLLDTLTNLFNLLSDNRGLVVLLASAIAGAGALATRGLVMSLTGGRTIGGLASSGLGFLLGGGASRALLGRSRGLGGNQLQGARMTAQNVRSARGGGFMANLLGSGAGALAFMGLGGARGKALTRTGGAGLLNRILASPALRRFATGLGAIVAPMTRLAPILIKVAIPLTTIATIAEILGPALGRLGDHFQRVGDEKGGALGALLNGLGALFKAFRLIGNVIGLIFDAIVFLIRKLFELLGEIPGVGKFFDKTNETLSRSGDVIDNWNENITELRRKLRGVEEQTEATTDALAEQEQQQRELRNEVSVFFAGRQFAVEDFVDIMRSAFPTSNVTVVPSARATGGGG